MQVGKIEINSEICNGKPVIAGTRITIAAVLEQLAAGDPISEVLQSYPRLTEGDVLACIDYAAKSMNTTYGVYPLS